MANWSDILPEIIRKIATEHVESFEDFETLSKVCSKWRVATKGINFWPSKNTQHPWLMLVDPPDNSYRRFYSLSKHMFRKFDIPRLEDDHLRYFSSKGWLISVSMRDRNITLFDPVSVSVSGKVIKPPSIPLNMRLLWDETWDDDSYSYNFSKFILSKWASPSCGSSDDDIAVVMIFDAVAIWTPGEHNWTMIPTSNWVFDVCFFRGEFYAIDHLGLIIAFGIEVAKRNPRTVVDLFEQGILSEESYATLYLVEVEGTLLVINRDLSSFCDEYYYGGERPNTNKCYWTCRFEVYELDVDNGKAKQVEGVGDRAIFVGFGSSTFYVNASSNKSGCKANCIYFTDDYIEAHSSESGGGSDMGIYSLTEGKIIERFYQGPSRLCFINPSIWVERPHF